MIRRAFIGSAGMAVLVALAACTNSAGQKKTPAQIIADVKGALLALDRTLANLAASNPPVLTPAQHDQLRGYLVDAETLVQGIDESTPAQTADTTLGRISGYLNATLATLAGLPLPPAVSIIVLAASIIAPELTAYLDSLSNVPVGPPAAVTRMAAKARTDGMTLEKARVTLNIPTK